MGILGGFMTYIVVSKGTQISHYDNMEVFITEWIGDWGKDYYTGLYFNIKELEKLEDYL